MKLIIDFSLVRADDAWIEHLGSVEGPDPWVTRRDRLAEVLLSWRLDVDAEPIGGLIEQDEAVAVVWAARKRERTLEGRLWAKVKRGGSDECWLWQGSKDSNGYGRIKVRGRWVGAHRVAYKIAVGPIPDGRQLDHTCRQRRCVNPAHLEPVTSRENTLRGQGPAGRNARKTHCVHGHELTSDNVAMVNTGRGRRGRRCLTCRPNERRAA